MTPRSPPLTHWPPSSPQPSAVGQPPGASPWQAPHCPSLSLPPSPSTCSSDEPSDRTYRVVRKSRHFRTIRRSEDHVLAGHVWAYCRVSTRDQNPQLQLDALEASGYDTLMQEKES